MESFALLDLPLHLVADVITEVVLSADENVLLSLRQVNGIFEAEVTKLISRYKLLFLARTFDASYRLHDVKRQSTAYQIAKSFQLRLVVENLEHGFKNHKLRNFLHQVTDDIFFRMMKSPIYPPRKKVLQDVCKVSLAHHGCYGLLHRLGSEDFEYELPRRYLKFPDLNQDIPSSSLVVAIAFQYAHMHELILEGDIDVNFHTEHFGSPLEASARFGHVQTLELLLNHTSDDQKGKELKFLALHAAASYGQFETVSALITPEERLGSDPGDWSSDCSAIAASGFQRFDIAKMILERHPGPERRLMDIRENLCCVAVKQGNDEFLLEMIRTGVDLNQIYYNGGTPLSFAATMNKFDTVDLLLKNGAMVRSMAKDAFVMVANLGNLEMVQHMCKRNIHKAGKKFHYRIHQAFCAAATRGHLPITKFLLGQFPNKQYLRRTKAFCHGYHTLHGAMNTKHYNMVRWLIEECELSAKRYPQCPSTTSPSPVFDAINVPNTNLMILLFQLGAIPLDLDNPAVYTTLNRHDKTDLREFKAQDLNRRWFDARKLGTSKEEFFGQLEKVEWTEGA